MAPRAVLMKTGLKSVNTARPVNTVRSVNTGRPFSTARSFNTVRPSYTAHPKSTNHCARPRTYFQNQAQSTVWKPKNRVIDHVSKNNIASVTLKRLDYIDAQGRFKSGRHEHEPKFDYDFNTANVPVTTVGAEVSTASPEVKTARSAYYYCWFKITAVGEKVNAAESLLVVSTEVNAD
ncbi:hypothetical protein Tco_0073691 [Tanacetum coccineum]